MWAIDAMEELVIEQAEGVDRFERTSRRREFSDPAGGMSKVCEFICTLSQKYLHNTYTQCSTVHWTYIFAHTCNPCRFIQLHPLK